MNDRFLRLFIGFFTFGSHILLVAALPVYLGLGTRKAASSVSGFIDAMGYLGSGYLVEKFGWNAGFI